MNIAPFEPNTIHCSQSEKLLARLPAECIDLTVTSPPYDNLRDYNGYTLDWHEVIRQLYRVTKPGGVVVWVVADATINGSETGTSFRQALWAMECGFRLHDTMIYETDKPPMNDSRYQACFEYMFVFSKGKPKTFNPIMVQSKQAGKKRTATYRKSNGKLKNQWRGGFYEATKIKSAIWKFYAGASKGTQDSYAFNHPGTFPEALARDHILSWSNPGDIVLDPFIGSGTTAKMAYQNGRKYLGFDVSEEYCELARKRVAWANPPLLVVG